VKITIQFFFLTLFFLSGFAKAIETTWDRYYISDVISLTGDEVMPSKIDEQFKGKTVSIDDKMVNITGACRYEYTKTAMSPIKYWHSLKTVELYRQRLAENNIKLGETLSRIIPRYPSTDCPYPFSLFIQIDDELIFILDNRMIIYSQNIQEPVDTSGPICIDKEQTPDQAYEEGSITECSYPKLNLLETYAAWRESLPENKDQLPEKLPTKNTRIVCKEVCVSVVYAWQASEKLEVIERFAGGETHTHFSRSSTGTNVTIISFRD